MCARLQHEPPPQRDHRRLDDAEPEDDPECRPHLRRVARRERTVQGWAAVTAPYRALLNEADFYLVRLGCSFRARRDQVQVEWARFLATLLPGEDGRQPIAFDLHPLMIASEARRNVKVSLSPALKFSEVEASLGSLEFGLEYPDLQPIVSASGVGEANPSWDYETAHGQRIQGSKWMHILVKAPKGTISPRSFRTRRSSTSCGVIRNGASAAMSTRRMRPSRLKSFA